MKNIIEYITETSNLRKFPVIAIGPVQKHKDGSIHTSKIRQEYDANEEVGIALDDKESEGIILIGYTEGMDTEGQLVNNDSGKNIRKFKDATVIKVDDIIKKYHNYLLRAYVLK